MSDARGTLRGLALLALLLLLLHFTRPDPARDLAGPLLPDFDPRLAAAFVLRDGSDETAFVRSGGIWRFGGSEGPPARGERIERCLMTLAVQNRYLELPDVDPFGAGFGLARARVFRIALPGRTHEVAVGRATPSGEGLYALVDGLLVVTGREAESVARLDARTLRESRPFDLPPERIARLLVEGAAGTLELERSGDTFRVGISGRPRAADRARVETLFADLANLESPLYAPGEEGAPAGWPDSAPRVAALDADGATLAAFSLGGDGSGGRFARGSSGVFLIPEELAGRLLSPAETFRTRVPFDFDLSRANRVVLARPGTEPVEFLRLDAGRFSRVAPGAARGEFPAATVETALLSLTLLPVTGHPDPTAEPRCGALLRDHGLAVKITLDGDPARALSLLLPRPGGEDALVYALPDDEFHAVEPADLAAALREIEVLLR